jgi:hypothetical protein
VRDAGPSRVSRQPKRPLRQLVTQSRHFGPCNLLMACRHFAVSLVRWRAHSARLHMDCRTRRTDACD